ncbi:MAG: TIGR00366 family protein [candidate division Zixibacteria bacterium]|nr:TIGR00366 family protein [candidate division Zixibacteria bacterium]
MKILSRTAAGLINVSERLIPSAFVIALILTLFTFVLSLGVAQTSLADAIKFWGNGFWKLLPFAMQMCLIILTGYIVASSAPVAALLEKTAGLAKGPKSSILVMTLASLVFAFFHWGLSMVGSALLVRQIARRKTGVDYPLLVAAAYLGMGCTWHAGLSASAPLLVATPGHFLESKIGLIPTGETIFSSFNLILAGLVTLVLAFFVPALHPASEKSRPVNPQLLEEFAGRESYRLAKPANWLDWWEKTPLLNLLFAMTALTWLWLRFVSDKAGLNIDLLNFIFLFLGLALHSSPQSFWRAAEEGGKLVFGVIIQFPFYAGMYGIIKESGLAEIVGNWFVSLSSAKTYPLLVYWYSGLVNYFVPSGGSKWAIEAPYLLEAAQGLGVPTAKVVTSYAWGDMATDLIQPFWAIPLLTVAKVEFKEILGYELLIFFVYILIVSVAFLFFI